MTRPHDLGGRDGFGPVPGTDDQLAFHAAWEARIFGILRTLIARGAFNFDQFRDAVERMEGDAYIGASYFERWVDAVERLLCERGDLSDAEVERLRALGREAPR
jgi:hypothetical protein